MHRPQQPDIRPHHRPPRLHLPEYVGTAAHYATSSSSSSSIPHASQTPQSSQLSTPRPLLTTPTKPCLFPPPTSPSTIPHLHSLLTDSLPPLLHSLYQLLHYSPPATNTHTVRRFFKLLKHPYCTGYKLDEKIHSRPWRGGGVGWKTNKVQAEQAKRLLSEGLKRAEEVAEVLQAMSGKVERKGREQEDSQLGRWMAKEVERTGEVTMSLQHFMETLQR